MILQNGSTIDPKVTNELQESVDSRILKAKEITGRMTGRPIDEIYVVWFCKTLQHWKALTSTIANDGLYYEITYNGDVKAAYVDCYGKKYNLTVHDNT